MPNQRSRRQAGGEASIAKQPGGSVEVSEITSFTLPPLTAIRNASIQLQRYTHSPHNPPAQVWRGARGAVDSEWGDGQFAYRPHTVKCCIGGLKIRFSRRQTPHHPLRKGRAWGSSNVGNSFRTRPLISAGAAEADKNRTCDRAPNPLSKWKKNTPHFLLQSQTAA